MTESSRPFVAFISYSHRDTQWAAWIQKAVERYRLPNALAKETGLDKRIGKVFRDREELATGQNLGDHLLEALDNSDNLIVICSPNAVNSQWVGQEIEYFKKIGRGDRIFCLLVEGGAEALPQPLLTDVEGNPLEPLAADPRDSGDGKRLAKLKLISGILGVKLDQLTRREQARQNQLRAIYTSITGLFVLMGAAAFVSYQQQQLAKEREAFERENAMTNAANMVEFAESIANQIDMESRAKVNDQLIEYLERSGTDNLDIETTKYLAQAYQQLGIAKLQQGTDERAVVDLAAADQAVSSFGRSAELYEFILNKDPQNPDARFDMAIADFWKGNIRLRRGELELAKVPLRLYARQMNELYDKYPNNPDYVIERVFAQQSLLTLRIDEVNTFTPELAGQIRESVEIARTATSQFPENPEIWDAQLGVLNLAASGLAQECLYNDKTLREYRSLALNSALRAFELRPRSRYFKQGAAEMYAALAHTDDALGNFDEALASYLASYRLRIELADTDPTNKFAAAQVVKSQLDIFRLTTHAKNEWTKSYTSTQAVSDLKSQEGRLAAREAGLEDAWLLFSAEETYLAGDLQVSRKLLDDLFRLHYTNQTSSQSIKPLVFYSAILLADTLGYKPKIERYPPKWFDIDEAQNCRSRTGRWLWALSVANWKTSRSEREALENRGFEYSWMRLYDTIAGPI